MQLVTTSRPRLGWEGNIKVDIKGIRWVNVEWINLAYYKDKWRDLENTVMNLRVT
jgi:hypothetical protein